MLCTSGFVDDVMLLHSRANGPDSGDAYVSSSSPGDGITRSSDSVVWRSSLWWRKRGLSLPFSTASYHSVSYLSCISAIARCGLLLQTERRGQCVCVCVRLLVIFVNSA